jgi:hypothetical protein
MLAEMRDRKALLEVVLLTELRASVMSVLYVDREVYIKATLYVPDIYTDAVLYAKTED